MVSMSCTNKLSFVFGVFLKGGLFGFIAFPLVGFAEDLGAMWGTGEAEAEYYRIVDVPIPPEVPMHPGSFDILPDGLLTRANSIPEAVFQVSFENGQQCPHDLQRENDDPGRLSEEVRTHVIPCSSYNRIIFRLQWLLEY